MPVVDVDARMIVPLSGIDAREICRDGHPSPQRERDLVKGSSWPPRAWTRPNRDRPCRFLAVVFRRNFVRFVLIALEPGQRPQTVAFHHTARPASGA